MDPELLNRVYFAVTSEASTPEDVINALRELAEDAYEEGYHYAHYLGRGVDAPGMYTFDGYWANGT